MVPTGANRFWWKRVVPPLEFGAMHAISFQMSLLPLTMCRNGLSRLSISKLRKILPFNRVTAMHIHLGYTMVFIVFISTLVFFLFFGLLCQEQKLGVEPLAPECLSAIHCDQDAEGHMTFCERFHSEIMLTGYGIILTLIAVALTSYFRYVIPYEVFYAVHHLVFVMFALTLMHTNDNRQRNGKDNRSQTFKWFTMTLLYYCFDRVYMASMHTFYCKAQAMEALGGGGPNNGIVKRNEASDSQNEGTDLHLENGGGSNKMVTLRLLMPLEFHFVPGNYAYLRFGKIDSHWHPFSIASAPNSDTLDFFIEVFGEDSWTAKLWQYIHDEGSSGCNSNNFQIEVRGPYGSSVGILEDYTHALMVGTGTGIVPMFSYLRHHLHNLAALEPSEFFKNSHHHRAIRFQQQTQNWRSKTLFGHLFNFASQAFQLKFDGETFEAKQKISRLSIGQLEMYALSVDYIASFLRLRMLRKHGKDAAVVRSVENRYQRELQRSLRGVAYSLLPVFLVFSIAITLSWNSLTKSEFSKVSPAMKATVLGANLLGLALFVVETLKQPAVEYWTLVDVAVINFFNFLILLLARGRERR